MKTTIRILITHPTGTSELIEAPLPGTEVRLVHGLLTVSTVGLGTRSFNITSQDLLHISYLVK